MKIRQSLLFLPILLLYCGSFALAATPYTPLAPIPSLDASSATTPAPTDLSTYLKGLYSFGVGAAAALAVIVIIWGGIEYMTTDAIGHKEEGKQRIQAAVLGLLLALSSYVILKTINVDLLNTSFGLETLYVGENGAVQPGNEGKPLAYVPGTATAANGTSGSDVTGSANFAGSQITHFGGPNDMGVTPTETGSVSGQNLRSLDPNTFYSAYPLAEKTPTGLPVYANTATANQQLAQQYMVYNNGGTTVVTQIIDRGPGNPNASLDTSQGTLNALGNNANPTVTLVPKTAYPNGPGVYKN